MSESIECRKCGQIKDVNEFNIVDFDEESESFVRADSCTACTNKGKSKRVHSDQDNEPESEEPMDYYQTVEEYAYKLAGICQLDMKIISAYDEIMFYKRAKSKPEMEIDFNDVQARAIELTESLRGLEYKRESKLQAGNYIVAGDSHGMYELEEVVKVIGQVASHFDAQVIHVGHMTDNHGCLSKHIFSLPDLHVIPMANEISRVAVYQKSHPTFSIVRERIEIAGKVLIRNQNYRSDYTIGNCKSLKLNESGYDAIVVNRHMHELCTYTKNGHRCRLATPGSICSPHQSRPPRKRVPNDREELINLSLDKTYSGRRQDEVNNLWENGIILLHVMPDGNSTVVPMRIKKVGGKYVTAYGRNVFTASGIDQPDSVGLVVGDAHVNQHDTKALAVVDKIAKYVKPDFFVNLGDHVNCSSLNHHAMDRGQPIVDEDVVNECGKANFVLDKMSEWSDKNYIIIGNHERFMNDFYKKYPQLKTLLNYHMIIGAEELGYNVVDHRSVLEIDGGKYIHGDVRMYGASGERHQKAREVLEAETMVGHCHQPSVSRGVYFIGLMGDLDQEYNEAELSNWMHGFGLVTKYGDETFMTTIGFTEYKTVFDNNVFEANSGSKWEAPEFTAKIVYITKDE